MKIKLLLLLTLIVSAGQSSARTKYLYAGIADKSVSLTPFYKVFGNQIDPAIYLGGGVHYLEKDKHVLFQNVQTSCYQHSMIGTGLKLSTSVGYRYSTPIGFYGEAALGIGLTGFLSRRETYVLNNTGSYEKASPLHGLIGVPIDLSAGYQFDRYRVFLNYRYMIEGNYTNILPLLPSSLIGVGMAYILN